jgi:hypothetical protein
MVNGNPGLQNKSTIQKKSKAGCPTPGGIEGRDKMERRFS